MSSKPRILIVDDNKGIQIMLRILLGESPCVINQATNGVEAIEFLRAQPSTDLVILDLRMPRSSGQRFLEVREADEALRAIPVLILSGDVSIDEVARRFNIKHCVKKGGNPEHIVDVVRSILPAYREEPAAS